MDGDYRMCGTFIPSYMIENKNTTQNISSADSASVI